MNLVLYVKRAYLCTVCARLDGAIVHPLFIHTNHDFVFVVIIISLRTVPLYFL